MPELPEVETIARELRPDLVGRTILDASFDWPNQIKYPAAAEFAAAVRGREVLSVDRRAKWVVAALGPALEGGEAAVLAIQVKMTGQLDVVSPDAARDKHVHVVMPLDNGQGAAAARHAQVRAPGGLPTADWPTRCWASSDPSLSTTTSPWPTSGASCVAARAD